MTPYSESGLSLEYLNEKLKLKSKTWRISLRSVISAGIYKYIANESLFLLRNVYKFKRNVYKL